MKKWFKKTKKEHMAIFGFFGITSIMTVSMILSTSLNQKLLIEENNMKYFFENQRFSSKNEMIEYATNKYFVSQLNLENRYKWSINKNDQELFYNDPNELRKELLKQINVKKLISSKKINVDETGIGDINGNEFSKLYLPDNNIQIDIYKGKNDSIYTTEKQAKKSYLNIHDAYYFNNIYFRDIEELKLYLKTHYYADKNSPGFNENTKNKTIGIKNSDNVISSPISQKYLFSEIKLNDQETDLKLNAKKEFSNFINSSSKKYWEIKTNDNRYKYFDSSTSSSEELLNYYNNPEYFKIYTNNGHDTYIVDLDKDDENTLFGPYYTNKSNGIDLIKDHKQWKKIKNNDFDLSMEQFSGQLANFLSLILFEDENEKELPFNIHPLNDKVLKPFFNRIKNEIPKIFNDFISFTENIKRGKRFNYFYAIPIYYIWFQENLIKYKAKQELINLTKNTFNNISKYIDYVLDKILPKELLKSNDGAAYSKISFEQIFDFMSNNFNLNINIEYFINKIWQNYPEFINAINIISYANINSTFNYGVIPFHYDAINDVIDKSTNSLIKLNRNNLRYYEKIWDLFSSSSIVEFQNLLSLNNSQLKWNNEEEKNFWTNIIFNFKSTNQVFNDVAKKQYDIEIKQISQNSNMSSNKKSIFRDINSSLLEKIRKNPSLSFKNFLLINFISKDSNSFSSLINLDFNIDQSNLEKELIKLCFGISIPSFLTNFQINKFLLNNVIDFLHTTNDFATKYKDELIKTNNFLSNVVNKIGTIVESIEKIAKNTTNITNNVISKIIGIGGSIGKFVPYAQIALIGLDLVISFFVPKTEYFAYKFETPEGLKFIWNGGKKTTAFWGAYSSETTIDSMKLIQPQKVVYAKAQDSYYFDGIHYDNLDSLKKYQLEKIFYDENYSVENIKSIYSFEHINTSKLFDHRFTNAFLQIGDERDLYSSFTKPENVVQDVFLNVKNDLTSSLLNGKYYVSNWHFANGLVVNDKNQAQEISIKNVVDKIKPIKIIQLPTLKYGKPIDDDLKYELPFISWTQGQTIINKTNNKYLIYDPNKEETKDVTDEEIVNELERRFLDYFDVEHKQVIKYEILTNNKFSSLSSNIISNNVYEVKLSNNYSKYFLNQNKALNWLMSQSNFTLYSYYEQIEMYKYDKKIFYSKEEFTNFVLSNAEVKNE